MKTSGAKGMADLLDQRHNISQKRNIDTIKVVV